MGENAFLDRTMYEERERNLGIISELYRMETVSRNNIAKISKEMNFEYASKSNVEDSVYSFVSENVI